MKKYFLIILCALPFVSQAQMTAVAPDATKPTQHLTGNAEFVHVFFDKTNATFPLPIRQARFPISNGIGSIRLILL